MIYIDEIGLQEKAFERTVSGAASDGRKVMLKRALKSVPSDMLHFAERQAIGFSENDLLLNEVIEQHQRDNDCTFEEAFCYVTGSSPLT